MHKTTDMTIKEFIGHLEIEEENCIKDKRSYDFGGSSKANLVEPKTSNNSDKNYKDFKPQEEVQKYKFKGSCHNWCTLGHKFRDCRSKKKAGQNQASIAKAVDNIVAIV